MGYMTIVVVNNDALHEFEKDPKLFGETVFEGIRKAYRENKQVSMPFKSYCNYISVEPSTHSSDEIIYFQSGGSLNRVQRYCKDWEDLVKRMPDLAARYVKAIKTLLGYAKEALKKEPVS